MKGSFHELKGTIKEQASKIVNDRQLKVEGKIENNTGRVQQQIGHAKDAAAKLRGKLAEIKKVGYAIAAIAWSQRPDGESIGLLITMNTESSIVAM